MTVFIEDSFDSAHWLPKVAEDHKCRRLHGHTYRIRLEWDGFVDPVSGFVIDYADLKQIWGPIKERLDHYCLNDILENPTCELLAEYIAKQMGRKRPARIELRETERCGVVWP